MKTLHLIGIVLAAGVSLGLGYSLYEKQATLPSENTSTEPKLLKHLPDFSYPDLLDNMRSSREWSDKVVVLNYWAAWCPPCKKEIPLFIETQKKYAAKVQFVGIAIDDKEPVREFADMMSINYPTLLGDMQAIQTSAQLGNTSRGLPFTAIFDSNGKLHFTRSGEIQANELEEQLQAIL